jgi:CubicO group peptidase (beta-lactamase class C family)
MGLLGYALAFRAGTGYERLVRARICAPLGLADTWIETPASERPRVAAGHTWRGRETPHWRLAALAGAGGLRSTAADLLAFLRLHTGGGESPLAAAARDGAPDRRRRRRAREPGPLGRRARAAARDGGDRVGARRRTRRGFQRAAASRQMLTGRS